MTSLVAILLVACGSEEAEAEFHQAVEAMRCTATGNLCIAVTDPSGTELAVGRNFMPAVVAMRGDHVDVVLRGALPGERVLMFSSMSLYDRSSYQADEDGTIAFTIEATQPGEHTVVLVGEGRGEGEPPAMWPFMVAVVPSGIDVDQDVIDAAAQAAEERMRQE